MADWREINIAKNKATQRNVGEKVNLQISYFLNDCSYTPNQKKRNPVVQITELKHYYHWIQNCTELTN